MPLLTTSDGLTDLLIANAIAGALIPAAIALLVKSTAPRWFKALANLALSAVVGVLVPVIAQGRAIDWQAVVLSVIQVFVISITTHYGLLKPTGVTGSTGAIAQATPGGIGPVATDTTVAGPGAPPA